MTLAVIRLHDASQASIQRYMSLGICGKHEQVRSTRTPTDLLLRTVRRKRTAVKIQKTVIFDRVMFSGVFELTCLAYSCLDDGIKASFWGVSVPRHLLLLYFLCEAVHLIRQRQDMSVAKLRLAFVWYPVTIRGEIAKI